MMGRRTLAEQQPQQHRGKQLHKLFSVVGWKLEGRAIELIVAKSEADAEDYTVRELGFVKVDNTSLVSDCVHVLV
jgi:hypothetical protein